MQLTFRGLALTSLLIAGGCKAGAQSEFKSDLPPQPPIWVVSDADSEITLYPTIHILPPRVDWKSEEMIRRLSEAEEIWFEIIPGSEAEPAMQQFAMQLGLAPGSSLSGDLTQPEVAALKSAIAPLGMPFEAIDAMRPWMASTVVSVATLIEQGFDPSSGVENQLLPFTDGKKIRALETAEQQITFIASLPHETQLQMLRQTLEDVDGNVDMLEDLVADWSVGDVKDLEDDLLQEMKSDTPKAYDVLITKRNANWADQIEIEMKGSGTDFIAVGTAHLVGEDSVPAMLKARGFTVKRL